MRRDRIAATVIASGAIAVGVIWLTYLFVRFGPTRDRPGSRREDYFGWGLDFQVYLGAATRITSEGTPYAAELVAAPFESGTAEPLLLLARPGDLAAPGRGRTMGSELDRLVRVARAGAARRPAR